MSKILKNETKTNDNIMLERYQACMLLHAVGDTIGFFNGAWEFNYGKNVDVNFSNELLFEFIDLGGINNIDLKGKIVSDDTVMHISTAEALLTKFKDINDFGEQVAKEYVKSFDDMNNREPGQTTVQSIELLKEGTKWNKIPIALPGSGAGNGASMRSACIGLAFHGKENRDMLIATSIEAGRITHNNAIGYLGSLAVSLFVAYAIEEVPVNLWPFNLVKLLESDKIDNYLKKTRGFKEYSKEKNYFIDNWKTYINDRFQGNLPIHDKSKANPAYRSRYYEKFMLPGPKEARRIGSGGHDSVIIAYDALVDSLYPGEYPNVPSWEKLVIYSMVHVGDSDSTGCLAGAFYGALFGFNNVPSKNLKYIEKRKLLIDLGTKLYEKYYDN